MIHYIPFLLIIFVMVCSVPDSESVTKSSGNISENNSSAPPSNGGDSTDTGSADSSKPPIFASENELFSGSWGGSSGNGYVFLVEKRLNSIQLSIFREARRTDYDMVYDFGGLTDNT